MTLSDLPVSAVNRFFHTFFTEWLPRIARNLAVRELSTQFRKYALDSITADACGPDRRPRREGSVLTEYAAEPYESVY